MDSAEENSGDAVTLVFSDWQVRFEHAGIYRIDSDPPTCEAPNAAPHSNCRLPTTPCGRTLFW